MSNSRFLEATSKIKYNIQMCTIAYKYGASKEDWINIENRVPPVTINYRL